MSGLTPDIASEVVAACEAGAEEAAGALGRSLDGEFTLSVGEAGTFASDAAPEGFDGPGLAVLLKFGAEGFVALLPESSGMLPDWYANPDPTGESKLSTLAQELSMLLVPETLMADDFSAARVENLSAALANAKVADNGAFVPLEISAGETKSNLNLIWPLAAPESLFPAEAENETTEPAATPAAEPTAAKQAPTQPLDFSALPAYSKSLLKISLPLRVVLAEKREKLVDVTELAAGTIIKFEKNCDEALQLCIENQLIAEGEAVKIGDKFGFRVSSMLMPEEHFTKVKPRSAG